MYVDLERLISDEPIAVRFETREEAELFVNEIERRYPEKSFWGGKSVWYEHYLEKGGVCYCPYFNNESQSMTHGSYKHFTEIRRFEVIDFKELVVENNLEIDFNDADICMLLG